jgi:hypothetical protein
VPLSILLTLPAFLDSPKRVKALAGGATALLVLVVLFLLLRSPDKAKPEFANCQFFEAQGEYIKAQEACQEAVAIAPKSKSGLAAAERLKVLAPQVQAVKDKQRSLLASGDPPCKAGKWMTRCIFKGKARPNPLESPTKSRCNQDASELRSNLDDMVCPNCVCADDFEPDGGPEEVGE